MDQQTMVQHIAECTERGKSNTKRINKLEGKVDDLQKLIETVAVLTEQMRNVSDDVREIKESVETVKQRPASAIMRVIWSAVTALISCGIGAAVGALIN